MDNKSEIIKKLMELKQLYEAGVLTKEELETEKAKLMNPTYSAVSKSTPTTKASVSGSTKIIETPPADNIKNSESQKSPKQTESNILRSIVIVFIILAIGLGIFAYYKIKDKETSPQRTIQEHVSSSTEEQSHKSQHENHVKETNATTEATNVTSNNGSNSSYDSEVDSQHGHNWGNGQTLHHQFSGVMTDDDGNNWPIQLDFDLQATDASQLNGRVSNVIYKNVTLGGKIRMTGDLTDGLLTFRGKDGSYDFVICIDVYSHQGTAVDGPVELPVWITPLCH